MVTISLYRGNLHRVPNVPRRWLMPAHKMSVRDFKTLLRRRSKALSRLHVSTSPTAAKITSSLNPNRTSNPAIKLEAEAPKNSVPAADVTLGIQRVGVGAERPSDDFKDKKDSEIGDGCLVKSVDGSHSLARSKSYVPQRGSGPVENGSTHAKDENLAVSTNPNAEASKKEDVLEDKEKRKKEVEDKLQVLNGKKHNLVQVLKQILHVEEELKRRSSMQGMASRPLALLQVDATADTGSMTRQLAPMIGAEVNVSGDNEGGEADDPLNHNVQSRQMLRTSSMSPSSESPLRRPPHTQPNVVSQPSRRSNFGITSSPSFLPPPGQPGLPPNLPTVSVSGTNYIASSPSPAASGGTSVSRDARQPSPWN